MTITLPARTEVDLRVQIGALELRNPVMPASGCFGPQLGELIDVEALGATVTKTVFLQERGGNPAHRLSEISSGVVNSVGIPSLGPAGYLAHQHGGYAALDAPTIISVGGHSPAEYAEVVRRLRGHGAAYELNVSCPNLDSDGRDIGSDPGAIRAAVTMARDETDKPLIVKLPVMTASIAECAAAAAAAGADAVCVANSVPAFPLMPGTTTPALGNRVGGLTGPAIRPIVLRLVWQAVRAVDIPVIACGGIETADDALEYFSLGASAVQVGTATFGNPLALVSIARELTDRCARAQVTGIRELLRTVPA